MSDTAAERGDATRRREAEREARKRGDFVAFAACSHAGGRVLKVVVPDQRRRTVTCPVEGCIEGAHGTFMPRARGRDENCDLESDPLPGDDGDPTTPESDPGSGRRKVSDAQILAALGEQDTPALEIARALGYSSKKTTPLMRRVRRMNERATAKGEPPPIALTIPGRGRPALLRRADGEVKSEHG